MREVTLPQDTPVIVEEIPTGDAVCIRYVSGSSGYWMIFDSATEDAPDLDPANFQNDARVKVIHPMRRCDTLHIRLSSTEKFVICGHDLRGAPQGGHLFISTDN